MADDRKDDGRRGAYADLAHLSETDRITTIGDYVLVTGQVAGFFVDDDAKADRYIRLLREQFHLRVIERGHPQGLKKGTVFVKVGPPES